MVVKPSEMEKEAKTIKKWFGWCKKRYNEKKWIRVSITVLIVISILIAISSIYLFYKGFLVFENPEDKISENPISNSYFYIDETGTGFKLNSSYDFEWTFTPLVEGRMKVIFYFKPTEENKIPPTPYDYDDVELKKGESITIDGKFKTDKTDIGKYTICGEIIDKSNLLQVFDYCHTTPIKVQ